MKTSIITGALVALLTGLAIGTQATISSRVGGLIGEFRTGLLSNLMGGLVAVIFMLFLLVYDGSGVWKVPSAIIAILTLSGTLGIFIITGISFSLQRAGIAAGLATIILGQLAFSFLIDSLGIGGVEQIPASLARITGLAVTAFGVYLLLPKG
ncbi:MAG: DMT family transporter [Anaerolineales bacterium]|nr:DMT family transporter [Anaerolineales bacterium]